MRCNLDKEIHKSDYLVDLDPFIDRVRELYEVLGVSTILVMGGSGDYFDVADTVILMDNYVPRCATEQAKRIAEELKLPRQHEVTEPISWPIPRCPLPESIDPSKGRRDVRIKSVGTRAIVFGVEEIDLSQVEQVVEVGQTRAIGDAIVYARDHYMDGQTSIREIIEAIDRDIDEHGLNIIDPLRGRIAGDYARPRPLEIAAAINRLRTLRVRQKQPEAIRAD